MPRLSIWSIRAALLYLLVGFAFGALLLFNKGYPIWPLVWLLLPAHIEFLLVGWMVQLALGVAFWILPRYSGGSRGDERLAWAAIGLLNLGLLLAALAPLGGGLLLAGRLCQLLGGLAFAAHAWGRVRPLVIPS